MGEISLIELFYIFKKRIWLIIALTILGLVIASLVSFYVITPKYQTSVTLMVGKPIDYEVGEDRFEYDDMLLNERLVHTYAELVKSREVSDKVIEKLKLDTNYSDFQSMLGVSLVNDTEIIRIQVENTDKELAANIANSVSEEFIKTANSKMKVENVQVIDEAPIPDIPISPKKVLNMSVGTVFGLIVGLSGTFLLEYLDNTFKSSDEIETILKLPVVGVIPDMGNKKDENIVQKSPKSPIAESFKTMRTNIQFVNIDKDINLLAVTSSIPEEGKGTIITNLASSIVQEGKKVLIIDADLRKPKKARVIKTHKMSGLTNILMGTSSLEESVYEVPEVKGLYTIISGSTPPNPSELIRSQNMKDLIKLVRKEYDMVILDTPPVGLVTDAAIISTLVDGVLLVIEAGKTEIGQVQESKKLLDNVNANIIGAVLNKLPLNDSRYGYNKYSDYYGEN